MARVYQESHILENLSASVKALQAQADDFTKAKSQLEEKVKKLTTANDTLTMKNAELEVRLKAKSVVHPRASFSVVPSSKSASVMLMYDRSEHNAVARTNNSHIAQSSNPNHAKLTPLHDLGTNRPIRQFPKHERDIKTMGQSQVVQVLQALDVKSMGMGAADRKAEVRRQLGLPKETSVTGN
ncbi:MAG: hypothetical protein Q9163_001876 [Psora crenata]